MASTPQPDGAGQSGLPTFSQAEIARAQECFRRAQELVNAKNYEYAIELYIQGLRFWPEAVDEGHKPCRAASLFRGKTKIGFGDKMKYKTNAKDAREAMVNAEMLLSKDPQDIGNMEALLKNAEKGGFIRTAMWISEIYEDTAVREPKGNPARFQLLRDVYERIADRVKDTDLPLAIEAMDRAVNKALPRLKSLKPTDGAVANDLRDMAGKLTILRGKYGDAESFKDSVHDSDAQKESYDKDRLVQADERIDELITLAQGRYEANPKDQRLINDLVDLLCRREREEDEKKAISILIHAHKESGEYRYKSRACDIRMKQNGRVVRNLKKSGGDPEKITQAEKDALAFELQVYKDRIKNYPTDMRLRFEYGRRLFDAVRYDDAIPFLQEARADRKVRFQSSLYVGQCFYEKGYYAQAIDSFREGISTYEIQDDDLAKELQYWLGRSYEADKRAEDALKIYGQLIRLDYNYRKGDVRKRIDDLHASR